jgi:putative SOS response-associated peptidase YedK
MCGRYHNRAEKQRTAEAFRVGIPATFELLPSRNIAPQTDQPIVRLNRDTAERELALLRWGLVPFFAKDPEIGYSTVIARAETVTASPTFQEAMNVGGVWFHRRVFTSGKSCIRRQSSRGPSNCQTEKFCVRRPSGSVERLDD